MARRTASVADAGNCRALTRKTSGCASTCAPWAMTSPSRSTASRLGTVATTSLRVPASSASVPRAGLLPRPRIRAAGCHARDGDEGRPVREHARHEVRPRADHRRADGRAARALQRVGDAGAGLRGVCEGDEARVAEAGLRARADASRGECELGRCDGLLRVAHRARAQGGQARARTNATACRAITSGVARWASASGRMRRSCRGEERKIADAFPWGSAGRRRQGRATTPARKSFDLRRGQIRLNSYREAIVTDVPPTAPVGSFPANQFGPVRSRRECLGDLRGLVSRATRKVDRARRGLSRDPREFLLLRSAAQTPVLAMQSASASSSRQRRRVIRQRGRSGGGEVGECARRLAAGKIARGNRRRE